MFPFGVGWQEFALLFLVAVAVAFCRGTWRRWACVLAAIIAISSLLTPADPASTLLMAAILWIAFALGVAAAPYLAFRGDSRL